MPRLLRKKDQSKFCVICAPGGANETKRLMSYLKKIKARAFKGRSFEHSLGPVTLIHGGNFLGKTAVADAVRIALLGYSPRHGQQPGKTWGFAGLPEGTAQMWIEAELSEGQLLTHEFQMSKGRPVYNCSPPDGFPLVPPVLLDVQEFLRLSGPAKVRFIFNQIDLEAMGFSTEKVTARIKADVKLDKPDEISETILGQIIDDVENLAAERDEFKRTHQDWIAALTARIKEQKQNAEAVAADMEGTIQGMTQLRAQEGLAASADPAKDIEVARKQLQDAIVHRESLQQKFREYHARSTRRDNLKRALIGLSDFSEQIAEMEKQHAEQVKKLQGHKSDVARLLAEQTKANADASNSDRAAKEREAAAKELILTLQADLKLDACPFCQSKGKGWKAALKKSVKERFNQLQKEKKEWMEKAEAANQISKRIGPELVKAMQIDNEIDAIRTHNFTLGRAITDKRKKTEDFKVLSAGLKELEDIGSPIPAEDIEAAGQKVREAQTAVALLEDSERQRVAAMQDLKRAEQARQQHAEKKTEIEVCKLALKALASLQAEMMDAGFDGFMEKVNLFCDGIMPGKLVYRDGEIGYFAGASFVNLDFFSGTEELLAFAGLSVALAQDAKIKLVILDELGRVHRRTKKLVLERMTFLVSRGVIHQALLLDVEPGNVAGVHTIEII